MRLRFLSVMMVGILAACAPVQQEHLPDTVKAKLTSHGFLTSGGEALPMRVWLPAGRKPRAVVVAVHGFNDYSRAFELPAWSLNKHGIAVYAYDQRGFGATKQVGIWPGIETLASDLKSFVRLVSAKHAGTPVYVLGESMGGAVVIATLTGDDAPKVAGAILSAPAVWGADSLPAFYRGSLWLMAHLVPGHKLTGQDLKILATSNIDMLRQMSRDPLVIKSTRVDAVYGMVGLMDHAAQNSKKLGGRVLVLYGAKDQVIPPPALQGLQLATGDKLLFSCYDKGYHMLLRDLDAEVVLRDVASWILRPAKTLPSKGDRRTEPCQLLQKK